MKKLNRKSDTYNFVDFIDADDPQALDTCKAAADAIGIAPKDEKDPHWTRRAKQRLATYLAGVVAYGKKEMGMRSLNTVAELLADPAKNKKVEDKLKQSEKWGGMLARMAHQLYAPEEELGSIVSVTAGHMDFCNSVAIAENMASSSFEPIFKRRKMTVYIVLPFEQMGPCAGWLRVNLDSFIKAIIREGLGETPCSHLLLDEAPTLQHLEILEHVIDKGAGYGLRSQWYYQAVAGLQKNFPLDRGQTLLSNASIIVFSCRNTDVAEMCRKMIGQETIWVKGGGKSDQRGTSSTGGAHPSWSESINSTESSDLKQQQRDVLTVDEILALPPRVAITFPGGGMRPVCTWLPRWFEEPTLWKSAGIIARFNRAVWMLVLSILMFCGMAFLAWYVTVVFIQ